MVDQADGGADHLVVVALWPVLVPAVPPEERAPKVVEQGADAERHAERDKLEAGQAVYAVRDIEAGRWGLRLTAERTT